MHVVSVLHHSLPASAPHSVAEEEDAGWHFRSAKAIRAQTGFEATSVRPSGDARWVKKGVDNVQVVLAPTIRLLPRSVWKWSEFSPAMIEYVRNRVNDGALPYIHEYRTMNSTFLITRLLEWPMILQHHGSAYRPARTEGASPLRLTRCATNLRRERLLTRVRGTIFVLSTPEKDYLLRLGVDARVSVRTMGVNFDDVRPADQDQRQTFRRENGIPDEALLLLSYVGVFGERLGVAKGAHYILRIQQSLERRLRRPFRIVVSGLDELSAGRLRERGVMAYHFMPRSLWLKFIASADIYFLPATPGYRNGGPGVTAMEALACGVPVVSPTLDQIMDPSIIPHLGIMTPYVEDNRSLELFLDDIVYASDNLSAFKQDAIREMSRRYYSWESFAKEFSQAALKS